MSRSESEDEGKLDLLGMILTIVHRARVDGPGFIRIGRLIRYRPTGIEKWIDQKQVEPSHQNHAS